MSAVRMCDNCGKVFSENSEGWTTFSGSRRKRAKNDSGSFGYYMEEIVQDWCALCSNKGFHPEPKALNGTDETLDRLADTIE